MPGNASEDSPSLWRNEVQARVAGYRNRRGRRIEGAFSMRFPFPPQEPELSAPYSDAAVDLVTQHPSEVEAAETAATLDAEAAVPALVESAPVQAVAISDAGAEQEASFAEDNVQQRTTRRSRRKVIAFPRPAVEAQHWEEPPLPEQPRIFEVQEELPLRTTPLLDGLVFPAQPANASASSDHIELPLQAVALRQRVYAGVLDCTIVAVATVVFAAAGYKFIPSIQPTKPLLLAVAAIPLLLWTAYEYLSLMYAGRTAGMQWAGLRLSSFKGGFPSPRQRRNRVLGLYFSAASLMMGLLWALVDVDALCWHDRISRTYVTKADSDSAVGS